MSGEKAIQITTFEMKHQSHSYCDDWCFYLAIERNQTGIVFDILADETCGITMFGF